jgi:hypothetical protein
MIKDASLVDQFEKEQIRKRMPDFFQNLRIFKSLYKEAMHLGIFHLKDSRDGIEADINLAGALNVRRSFRKKCRRPCQGGDPLP